MSTETKIGCIKKYNKRFSMIPLKGESGKQKEPAIKEWQQYSHKLSDFSVEELSKNNYGIVSGPASGLTVIDIDNSKVFDCFSRRYELSIPEEFIVTTGKGRHLYCKYPTDGIEYGCRVYGCLGFDVRSVGGMVVGPGSIHEATGKFYELAREGEIPELPVKFKEFILNVKGMGKPKLERIKNKEIVRLIEKGAENGSRSEAIFKVLISLVLHKFTDDEIFYIFNMYPVGEKYHEKPEHIKDQWLQDQIDKAIMEVNSQQEIKKPQKEIVIPEMTFLSGSDLMNKDCTVEWLIDDRIEVGGHTLITGRSGIKKSLYTLYLALTLASAPSTGFMGKEIRRPLTVVIIQCENSEAFMKKRLEMQCQLNPEFHAGKDRVHFGYINGRHNSLDFKLSSQHLEDMVRQIHESLHPDVIITDPYKSYSGVPENDNDANREVLDKFFEILGKYNMTSIIIHHEGKMSENFSGTSRSRGATTITDTVSNHWAASRSFAEISGEERFVISCAKSRNYQNFDDVVYEIRDGVNFKMINNPCDPMKLVGLLFESNGEIDTKGKFVDLIVSELNVSVNKAETMIKAAITKGLIKKEPHGKHCIKYCLPDYNKAA